MTRTPSRATVDYGDGVPVSYIGITEMRDGKIARTTRTSANPFRGARGVPGSCRMDEPRPSRTDLRR